MDSLKWLQNYYLECCNGDWEHIYGIKIGTLDNPGWDIDIDLEDTKLEDMKFEKIQIMRSEDNWIVCRVEDKKYIGAGGPLNLGEIIEIFKKKVEEEDAKIKNAQEEE